MTSIEPNSAAPPPRPRFQFTLRTLLLLFVVAASSLAVFGAGGIVVFMLVVGLAIYLREARSWVGLLNLLLPLLILGCLIGLLLPHINAARESGRSASCRNNMRQLGLALHNYHETYHQFPPTNTIGKDGKPLQSWRVLILPLLEYDSLYTSLDLSQSWDAPRNNRLLTFQRREFACPADPSSFASGTLQTNYFVIVGPNTAWDQSRHVASSGEEASHTIMLVEVANSGIDWAEPRDVSLESLTVVDAQAHTHPISSHHRPLDEFFFTYDRVSGCVVGMADGSVSFLRTDNLSPEELRKILQIGGCTDAVLQSQGDLEAGRRLNWPNIAALAVWLISVGALLTAAVRGRKARFTPGLPQ